MRASPVVLAGLALLAGAVPLAAQAPSRIEGSDVVAVSYPEFFDTLNRLIA